SIFPKTSVVYLEIGNGREKLLEVHGELNRDALGYAEPYAYHPHVTLAQEIPNGAVHAAAETANRQWLDFDHPKSFLVDELTFVQNTLSNQWRDLASIQLKGAPLRAIGR